MAVSTDEDIIPLCGISMSGLKITFSVFCVCSGNHTDATWTKDLLKHMRSIGLYDVSSTNETKSGNKQFQTLQNRLRTVSRLVFVFSPSSNNDGFYMNLVECSLMLVLQENNSCRIVPVLLTDDTELPFLLMNREPFLAWKDDVQKLVRSFFDTDEHLISYVHNIIQIFQQGRYLQSLNQCVLPPNVSAHVKNLGLSVLNWWGIQLSEQRLIVKMNQLQNIGYTQKILIRDLFSGILLPHEIRFIRVTGFDGFNYSKFKCQKDLFDDLVKVYMDIFEYIKTNNPKKTLV